MKRIITILILVFAIYSTSGATVINIPADYPTIQQGINASSDGDTVLVQPGTYVENINFNGHNIILGSLYLTTGDTSFISMTIIDGNNGGRVVTFENNESDSTLITGFSISNGFTVFLGIGGGIGCIDSHPIIKDNIIEWNLAVWGGGIGCVNSNPHIDGNIIRYNHAMTMGPYGGQGIYLENSNPIITSNLIVNNDGGGSRQDRGGGGILCESSCPVIYGNILSENISQEGGGICCSGSDAIIVNNIIYGNRSTVSGGGISSYNSSPLIANNSITRNIASSGGSGIQFWGLSASILVNTIFWDDSTVHAGTEIGFDSLSIPLFTYCDIQDTIWPGTGNVSVDPLFRDPENDQFYLMAVACGDSADSPCIDAGDPNIFDSLLDCSWGLGGLRSDMGAYGGGDSGMVNIIDNDSFLPKEITLLQNYPNPFNSGTTIRFIIVKSTEVRLAVYDILGRKVRTLIDEYKQAGIHTANFDATGLSSGVYFYRLQVGEAIETRPMVLLR